MKRLKVKYGQFDGELLCMERRPSPLDTPIYSLRISVEDGPCSAIVDASSALLRDIKLYLEDDQDE